MKTTWDGPQKTVDWVLAKSKKRGLSFKNDEVPYQCSWSGGASLARIEFGVGNGFELVDVAGNVVTGGYKQKGADGETVKLKVDPASEETLERILLKASHDCTGIGDEEEEATEELLKQRVRLKSYSLKGRIQDEDTFFLTLKLKGGVKWKKRHANPKIGKYKGSGTAVAKFEFAAPLTQPGSPLPAECLFDDSQGQHLYPTPDAFFEGWVEMTEVRDSDSYYLIFSDVFVSILEDFEEDYQLVAALLTVVDLTGEQCAADGRTRIPINLTVFGQENINSFLEILRNVELAITLVREYLNNLAFNWLKDAFFGSSPVGELADSYFKYVLNEVGIDLDEIGDDIADEIDSSL